MLARLILAALLLALAFVSGDAQLLTLGVGGGSFNNAAGCAGAADFSDGCSIAVFGH